MANLKSSKKDIRRIVKRTARNRSTKTKLHTLARRVTELRSAEVGSNNLSDAVCCYISALDKAVKQGIIHKNRANRNKSALSSIIFVNRRHEDAAAVEVNAESVS
jgi:small subunit ribosomal protein S20